MHDTASQVRGHKEGKALGVVVVGVGEENGGYDGLFVHLVLGDQLFAQTDDACTGVNDDQVVAGTDFYTSGVSTVFVRSRSRFGIPASYTPKGH